MNITSESVIDQFLRTYPSPFTVKELHGYIVNSGGKASLSDCKSYLEASPFVFVLKNNVYVTRAGAFTKKQFSFKPTMEEIKKKIFIPGHRCVPFANPEIFSCFLHFSFLGKSLPKKIEEFTSTEAINFFTLYGEEYASQYIASDPANEEINLAQLDFELPSKVHLTGISLEPIMRSYNFQYGDRLLCEVTNWDNGSISVLPVNSHNSNLQISDYNVKQQSWYSTLEKSLLEDFDYMGPAESIEKQLANVFFEYGEKLCCPFCGSVEELLQKSKKIDFESFGVETRIWRKGEDVPAVGAWDSVTNSCEELSCSDWMPSLSFLIDLNIKDFLYQKKDDFKHLLDELKIHQSNDEEKELIQKHIDERVTDISSQYNWFADFVLGAVRHRALKLYKKISMLIDNIMYQNLNLAVFPQQELAILTQLYTHLLQILESVENSSAYVIESSETIMLSLEGMELNFDDIKPLLCAAATEQYKKGFKVIK